MELIIEEIVDEISYLLSVGHLQDDIYLDDLVESMFTHSSRA